MYTMILTIFCDLYENDILILIIYKWDETREDQKIRICFVIFYKYIVFFKLNMNSIKLIKLESINYDKECYHMLLLILIIFFGNIGRYLILIIWFELLFFSYFLENI